MSTPAVPLTGPEPDLTIHDVQVRQQPVFAPGGGVGSQILVTYFVGTHGPFTLTYAPNQFSPEKARSDMDTQAVNLRRLITGM